MMKVTCSVRALQVIALMRVEECLGPTGERKCPCHINADGEVSANRTTLIQQRDLRFTILVDFFAGDLLQEAISGSCANYGHRNPHIGPMRVVHPWMVGNGLDE
jgi:hypothetical protein